MTEITQEGPQKKGAQFGSLRRQYKKARDQSEKTLIESGISPDNKKAFERARYQFAKQLTTKEIEGEVDVLTGLLNRRGFERRLREEAERTKRTGTKSVLIELDANEFKQVNDKYGHHKGDEILKIIAEVLKDCTRTSDVVARVGGDEFWTLLSPTDEKKGPNSFLDRLFKKFNEKGISISAGASSLDPKDIEGSMKRTDKAMYEAKKQSKENNRNIYAISN